MILVKPDLSFRGNLLIHPFLSFRIFALKKCGPNSAGFSMCKNRDASVSTRIFVETSPISPPQSLALIFMCVFSLWGTIRHTIYVFLTWGLNFNHFNQWHFHQPSVMVPYYSHTTSHKNLFKIWEFLWEAHHFWGSHYPGQLADFFPLRSSMPVPKRQNGNKPCRWSAASDHRMDHR